MIKLPLHNQSYWETSQPCFWYKTVSLQKCRTWHYWYLHH